MTHPIVVAVSEGDEARAAVDLGISAARTLGAPLVLAGIVIAKAPAGATVVPGWAPAVDPSGMRDYVARELHRQADAVPDDINCTISVMLATGIVPGLEMVVEREHAQLLVIGASHLGPLARSVRGDIAAGAAHHAGCAVLVAPADDVEVSADPPRRVGVAWDGSPEADGALDLAMAVTERVHAKLHIVRATEAAHEAEARRALDDAIARCGERVPVTGELHVGPAAGAVVEASATLDLLVVGARQRSAVAAITLGSVSTAVHRHARCPVLVVPGGVQVPMPA